ncbi:MAG: AMP-binding protein [Bacteroides sp.]
MRELDWSGATGISDLFRIVFSQCWERVAFTEADGTDVRYEDLAYKVDQLHQLFRRAGLQTGGRVALLGYNSAHWAAVYIATITYGAIIVPLPEDVKDRGLYRILEHAEAKLLFVSEQIWEELNEFYLVNLEAIICLQNWQIFNTQNPLLHEWEHIQAATPKPEKRWLLARMEQYFQHSSETPVALSYSSGTVGTSKGVLLAMRSLVHNVRYARKVVLLAIGDPLVASLPFSHIYGQVFDLLYGLLSGAHTYLLLSSPSISAMSEAFIHYRPRLIQIVPGIFERIFKSVVSTRWQRPLPHFLLSLPLLGSYLRARLRKQLGGLFGNNFTKVVLGGTLLNPVIEEFLHFIDFRYTLGYGLTESAALVTYRPVNANMTRTVGRPIEGMEVTIRDTDFTGAGTIFIRGVNLMLGYFKDAVETRSSFDDQGWFNTGDLGYVDKNNYLYVRGRRENALSLENGALVSPEELESLMNTMPHVQDSLVVERDGELVVLVQPTQEASAKRRLSEAELFFLMERNRERLNARLRAPVRLARVQIQYQPFELTMKQNIRRQAYLKADLSKGQN